MTEMSVLAKDLGGHVAVIEFRRGQNNFFSMQLIDAIADLLEELANGDTRAVVLDGIGRHFCAGADFSQGPGGEASNAPEGRHLYDAALRLFRQPLPVIAAVHGAAVGGGLGLALACDFRVATSDARFAAPFSRLGLHQGFGLSVTLPAAVGHQRAAELLYTGRRIRAEEAYRIGLCDRFVTNGTAASAAHELAAEIASAAPIAVRSIRSTMRGDLAERVAAATAHEKAEQDQHRATLDFAEGIRADQERRTPRFVGR
jgi:2-(1,2-epoxy-1,2-dihydrophenyl)acetyl-CoA isomerase